MNESEPSVIPLLASPQGGVAARTKKYREASADREAGWFSDENKWKTTPVASASVAARHFLDDATTPPCGDARRGILLNCDSFTPFTTAATAGLRMNYGISEHILERELKNAGITSSQSASSADVALNLPESSTVQRGHRRTETGMIQQIEGFGS